MDQRVQTHPALLVGDLPVRVEMFIREPQRAALTALPKSEWAALERAGQAPKRIRISRRRVAWRLSEIAAWIDNTATAARTV